MNSICEYIKKFDEVGDDFEFYPSTDEIIECVKSDVWEDYKGPRDTEYSIYLSVLDCGAGDGRVLNRLTQGNKYAIEKSPVLLEKMDKDIFVLGTNFHSQNLIDKACDLIFCNPPFSEFKEWMVKIIKEANCKCVYMVVPSRWSKSEEIESVIELRKAKAKVLGTYNFHNAERKVRQRTDRPVCVDVVKINLTYEDYHRSSQKVNSFDIWFEEGFTFKKPVGGKDSSLHAVMEYEEKIKNRNLQEVAEHEGLVYVIEKQYQARLSALVKSYKAISELDAGLLNELNIEVKAIKASIALKIKGQKHDHWKKLFDNLSTITDLLCSDSRSAMLKKLMDNTYIDYSSENAHAIVMWAVKNANSYFDSQLIQLVKSMTDKASIKLYKSNLRVFGNEDWRYCRKPEGLTHYGLEYRVILSRTSGLDGDGSISERAATLLKDILVVGYNLGFDTINDRDVVGKKWGSGKLVNFEYKDISSGELKTFMSVRAFYNGNLHIKFNQKFICKLNVEFGRLMGWLKDWSEAVDECDIPVEIAKQSFGCNFKLKGNNYLSLVRM